MSFINFPASMKLNHPFVKEPQINCVYRLDNGKERTIVVLTGEAIHSKMNWINLKNLVYQVEREKNETFQWFAENGLRVVSQESISQEDQEFGVAS